MVSLNEVAAKLRELADQVEKVEMAIAIMRTELQQTREEIKAELEKLKPAAVP